MSHPQNCVKAIYRVRKQFLDLLDGRVGRARIKVSCIVPLWLCKLIEIYRHVCLRLPPLGICALSYTGVPRDAI